MCEKFKVTLTTYKILLHSRDSLRFYSNNGGNVQMKVAVCGAAG